MIELAMQGLILAFSLAVLARISHFTIKAIEDLLAIMILNEASGISVGDTLGSNVFNIGIVEGLLAALCFLKKSSTDL